MPVIFNVEVIDVVPDAMTQEEVKEAMELDDVNSYSLLIMRFLKPGQGYRAQNHDTVELTFRVEDKRGAVAFDSVARRETTKTRLGHGTGKCWLIAFKQV